MFEQTFIEGRQSSKKPLTLALSLLLQAALVSVLTIVPLLYTHRLPAAVFKNLLVAPIPPRAAVSEPANSKPVSKFAPRVLQTQRLAAPVAIPKKVIVADQLASAPDIGVPGAVVGTDAANSLGITGVIGSVPGGPPPPATVEPMTKPPRGPVRFGSVIAEANLIRRVVPVYPPLAKSARIQGTVEFTALISKDGRIENLRLIHGHPLLVNAAREAVEQWKYRPTLLNGVPVEVITDIIVNFTLNQ